MMASVERQGTIAWQHHLRSLIAKFDVLTPLMCENSGALHAFAVDDVAFVQPMNLKSAFVTNSSLSVYARG